jgi:hypothetical protein
VSTGPSRETEVATVELLYLEGCPHHERLLARIERVLAASGVSTAVRMRRIADDRDARRERFLGSPTVRINGCDIEPGADRREDFGMKCRLYQTIDGLSGQPQDDWLTAAMDREVSRA